MRTACLGLAIAAFAQAGDFHTGQAARAVIGQPSFSARETGISANALSFARGRLYAAENNRVLAFDVSNPCAICGLAPVSVANESVMHGVSAVAVSGKVVVIADAVNRRVLIWRSTTPKAGVIGPVRPDVVLGESIVDPVSVAYDGHRLFVGDASQHKILIWNALPGADNQPADVVLGQSDNASGAASVGTPSALVSDGTNLFVADTENRRILIFSAGDFDLSDRDIINSATLLPTPLAPGTLVTIRATGATNDSEAADSDGKNPLPTELAGVEVYLNGAPLPLLSVSPEEIQAQLPYDLGSGNSGSLYLRSARDSGSVLVSSAAAVRFALASPGIFAVGKAEPRNGLLLHTTTGPQDEDGGPASGAPITPENPAMPGERVTVWANGLGFINEDATIPVHAMVNGEQAEVVSARLPRGAIGIYEVVIVLPPHFRLMREARLQLVQNSVPSNTVLFPVRAIQ